MPPEVHMSRRAEFQQLRGSDPTRLEIQVQDLLRRPVGQLAPANLMDLLALAEHPEPPAAIQGDLAKFVVRVKKEVSDLPSGGSWDTFVKEISVLAPEDVPAGFRSMIDEQKMRDDRDSGQIDGLLEKWSGTEPVPFSVGEKAPEIVKAKATRAPRKTTRKASAGAGRARPSAITDEDRIRLVTDLCMERLANASDSGLKELVLVAGVRHRAKEQYPNVTPNEVTSILKTLKATGRVRYSAGRWSSVARW